MLDISVNAQKEINKRQSSRFTRLSKRKQKKKKTQLYVQLNYAIQFQNSIPKHYFDKSYLDLFMLSVIEQENQSVFFYPSSINKDLFYFPKKQKRDNCFALETLSNQYQEGLCEEESLFSIVDWDEEFVRSNTEYLISRLKNAIPEAEITLKSIVVISDNDYLDDDKFLYVKE